MEKEKIMELLKEKILKDGKVIDGRILKVDNFLNHQIDINLFNQMGKEFKKRFENDKVDKILTIESSGIGIACITAQYFNVPVVFAKKTQSSNITSQVYETMVHSFTKEIDYRVFVSKEFIKKGEKILVIDDFLAHGEASLGLMDIIKQAGADLAGVGIVIEKDFQGGRQKLENAGAKLQSLAVIKSMKDGEIIFA